jgi:predicted metal-dependent TIM-barrel fold hydrolase
MAFNFDKILAAFGNIRAMERTHIDNHTEDIINSIDQEPFAISENNVLFAKISELGGYFYVITITVGAFKIKTMKGAKLHIESDDFSLTLNSDMDEFESDHSNVSNRYITRIDFQIEKEDVTKFDKNNIKNLTLTSKKQEVIFKSL